MGRVLGWLMALYPLPTELFYKHLKQVFITSAIKLFVFVIVAEVSIMVLFSYLQLDMVLSPLLLMLAGGCLFMLLIAVPFHAWIIRPCMDAIMGSQSRLSILASAVKYAGDGIMITNRNGQIEYINQALRDILLCENEDVIGQPVSTIDAEMGLTSWRRRFMHAIARDHVWHDERWGLRSNGEKYLAKVTVTPIRMQAGGGISNFITIVRDHTDRHALEMQYHQAQKMEAVGTLVGGIAHDFNNMLSSLTGHVYLAKAQLRKMPVTTTDAGEKIIGRLSQVETLSQHAAEMIQQLMTFARKGNVEKTAMALPSFMKEALKLAAVSLPANIHFEHRIEHQGMVILASATQLQQALMNLINNARDAVSDVSQPKISVSLKQVDASHASLQAQDAPAGAYVEICVADNGCGIDEDDISRVMEPFFTTKAVGKGTGLGLAMVYGIVKEHLGYIDIHSQLGAGASIHLFLPLTDCKRVAVAPAEQVYPGHGETILLVDDEPSVRQTCRAVLESLGYAVLEAGDGLEALEVYGRNAAVIAAVISDVVMPRMQGAELASGIKQHNPCLPVILVSGYHQEDVLDDSTHQYVDTMLAKPFSIASVSYALHRLLHGSQAACGLAATCQLDLCWSEPVPG